MRKTKCITWICTFLICISSVFTGCARDMNYVISHEPGFRGVVNSVSERYIEVAVDENDPIFADNPVVQVSLEIEHKDCSGPFFCGDKVAVYYDGVIDDGIVETVYGVVVTEPAQKESEKNLH